MVKHMNRFWHISRGLTLCLGLAACGLVPQASNDGAVTAGPETPRPSARPVGVPPPAGARTAAAFDTTTQAERAAAQAAPASGTRALGTTIASLGSPAEPGFWLRTALVTAITPGVVIHTPTGARLRLELRPSGGVAGSGSQLSLPAFRAMNLPLTGLPELQVEAE
jgi:hypothetical protein